MRQANARFEGGSQSQNSSYGIDKSFESILSENYDFDLVPTPLDKTKLSDMKNQLTFG